MSKSIGIDIEETTIRNSNYREVIYTGLFQLVLMSIPSNQDIGFEIHHDHDQFVRVESGTGKAIVGDVTYILSDNAAVVIPAGYSHNIISTGEDDLKIYTIYSSPEHRPGLIQPSKPEDS